MLRVLMFAAVLLVAGGPVQAAERVRVGILKLTSSAPIFIGVEKGFFQEQGVDVELTFFQAAAPIATALAAGQIHVGATGLTAALYNIVLGGERIWIVADKGREWPGYPLTAIVVQKDLCDVKIAPLQAMSASLEALRGKQVDAILIPQPFPGVAEAQGHAKVLVWVGDVLPWQCCCVFYGKKLAADRERAHAFMKGYVKASRYYYDAVLRQKDGRIQPGANHDEVVAITAKHTGASPDVIRVGFPYQDRNGRFPAEDIEKQMTWWVRHGFMKATIPRREIVDTSFVEAAIKALGE